MVLLFNTKEFRILLPIAYKRLCFVVNGVVGGNKSTLCAWSKRFRGQRNYMDYIFTITSIIIHTAHSAYLDMKGTCVKLSDNLMEPPEVKQACIKGVYP